MKLSELAKITKIDTRAISGFARSGELKTARKEKIGHQECWVIDDQEAKEFIKKYIIPVSL